MVPRPPHDDEDLEIEWIMPSDEDDDIEYN